MHKKPVDLHERLGSMRISASKRRAARANLEQSEAILDLIFSTEDVLRRAAASAARAFGRHENPRHKKRHHGRGVQNAL